MPDPTKVEDFFRYHAEAEEAIEHAMMTAQEEEVNFIDDLSRRFDQYGMEAFLTEDQFNWLSKITAR